MPASTPMPDHSDQESMDMSSTSSYFHLLPVVPVACAAAAWAVHRRELALRRRQQGETARWWAVAAAFATAFLVLAAGALKINLDERDAIAERMEWRHHHYWVAVARAALALAGVVAFLYQALMGGRGAGRGGGISPWNTL